MSIGVLHTTTITADRPSCRMCKNKGLLGPPNKFKSDIGKEGDEHNRLETLFHILFKLNFEVFNASVRRGALVTICMLLFWLQFAILDNDIVAMANMDRLYPFLWLIIASVLLTITTGAIVVQRKRNATRQACGGDTLWINVQCYCFTICSLLTATATAADTVSVLIFSCFHKLELQASNSGGQSLPPVSGTHSVLCLCSLTGCNITTKIQAKKHSTSFRDYPELVYCFTVNILAFLYAAYQLFKGICDIAHRGIFISDMVSDYISFIFDQHLL
ncbi:hypothetical protein Pfo_025436 [Paulownia fortunei]|nr:hypothetical protein Pfo_025436 [Paulownia fortunei]